MEVTFQRCLTRITCMYLCLLGFFFRSWLLLPVREEILCILNLIGLTVEGDGEMKRNIFTRKRKYFERNRRFYARKG